MIPRSLPRLPRLLLIGLVVALLIALLFAGATSSSAFGVYTSSWEGSSDLRTIAESAGTPTDILRTPETYHNASNESLAIILSPATTYRPEDRTAVRSYVSRGGTLLVAEDHGTHSNQLLAALGVSSRFDGRPVRDERNYYRSPALPVATNVSDHPLTNGTDSVTLNHGTVLEVGRNATVLVRTSAFAYVDQNGNAALDESETIESYPVVAVEPVGHGRVILVSDPSVFINAMLERDGNRAFVRGLATTHSRVLLDTSHTGGALPPIRFSILVLRDTPILAFLLGVLGVTIIGGWQRGAFPEFEWRGGAHPPESGLSSDTLVAAVSNAHPEWNRDHVERVVQALMSENEPEESND